MIGALDAPKASSMAACKKRGGYHGYRKSGVFSKQKDSDSSREIPVGWMIFPVAVELLTEAQRVELATLSTKSNMSRANEAVEGCLDLDDYIMNSKGGADWNPPEITELTQETVSQILDWRISLRAARLAEKEAQTIREAEKTRARQEEALASEENKFLSRVLDNDGSINSYYATSEISARLADVRSHKEAMVLVLPDDEFIKEVSSGPVYYRETDIKAVYRKSPNIIARAEEIKRKRDEEYQARLQEQNEKEAAKESRKQAQIAAWVEEHGTSSQKERLEAGLLPESEIVNAIRDQTFAYLDDIQRYEKIKRSDFCECEYPDPDSVSYGVEEATEASEEEFANLKAHRDDLPTGGTCTLQRHQGYCNDCEKGLTRASIRVEISVGEFTFSRLYAAE